MPRTLTLVHMAKLPEEVQISPTVAAIYTAYAARQEGRLSRRLGASIIGQECPRRIWYSFRWAGTEQFDGRKLRLFDTGHREEPRLVADLRAIGCEVWDVDEATGQQWEYTAASGHVVVKLDGVALGVPEAPKTPHVCEFKTHGAKGFAQVTRKGLKAGKPEHYAQLITGMKLSGIPRGLYLAVCKDTDELWSCRLRWEDVKGDADALLGFAEQIIRSDRAPERASEDRESLSCRWCPFNAICHGSTPPAPAVPVRITCRSCVHATAVFEEGGIGRWTCAKHNKTLGEAEQAAACIDHLLIPDFVTFAERVDAADDPEGGWIEYRDKSGATWRNGKRSGQYKSVELTVLPSPLVGAGIVETVKQKLGGEVVEVSNA